MAQVSLDVVPEESLMKYAFSFEAVKGGAISWLDCACEPGNATRVVGAEQYSSPAC